MATKLFFITAVPWIFEFFAYVFELKYGLYTKLILLGILPTAQHVARRLHFREFHHLESRCSQILVAAHEKRFQPIVIQLVRRRRQHGDSSNRRRRHSVHFRSVTSSSVVNTEQNTCTSIKDHHLPPIQTHKRPPF